ncbi:MAG: hypothetical protein JSU70_14910 [Phycisphaerales bacterium]|nr:MAG: hypothetical protein JSU70_14910 [Phycisphaerales bacterium]
MELSWRVKLRIAVTAALGVVLIGILAWPLAAPSDPLGPARAGNLGSGGFMALLLLAFSLGLAAYFLCWPHGREIAVLAVPSGLAVWAIRSGSVAAMVQQNPGYIQRQMLFRGMMWEPVAWLLVVAAGFGGVLLGQKLSGNPERAGVEEESRSVKNGYIGAVIALLGSVLMVQLGIRVLAQDVGVFGGGFVAQPDVGQITLAVLASFGLSSFVIKRFLNLSYIWPIVASALVTAFAVLTGGNRQALQQFAERWPAAFFPNAVLSVLPVQMVAFGSLGAIAGYWLAVRYHHWRQHEGRD